MGPQRASHNHLIPKLDFFDWQTGLSDFGGLLETLVVSLGWATGLVYCSYHCLQEGYRIWVFVSCLFDPICSTLPLRPLSLSCATSSAP
jgi:hypothetical protein